MRTREDVLHAARTMLGTEFQVVKWHDGQQTTPTLLIDTDEHGQLVIKAHRSANRHEREVNAYRSWTRSLGDLVPKLVAVSLELRAIVITALSGQPVVAANLSESQELEMFFRAGTILRRFHAAETASVQPGWNQFLAERGRYWLSQAAGRFTCWQTDDINRRLDALAELPAMPLAPCHLDFMPRNFIRSNDGTVRLVDFEHSRFDLPARDLVRLESRVWQGRPDLREAFLESYGPLTNLDRHVIYLCTAIDTASRAISDPG